MKIQIRLEPYKPRSKSRCWKCKLSGKWLLAWRDDDSIDHDSGTESDHFWDDDMVLVCNDHLAESVREIADRPAVIQEFIKVAEARGMDMSDPDTMQYLTELEEELHSPEFKRMIRKEMRYDRIAGTDVKAEQRDWEQS